MQLALTTAGARALLGPPRGRAGGHPGRARATSSRPCGTCPSGWPGSVAEQRPALVQQVLLARLGRSDRAAQPPRAEVGRALAALTRGLRVEQAAAEVGYSRRHLATWCAPSAG